MSDTARQSIRTGHPNPPCRALFGNAFTLRNFAYSAVECFWNVSVQSRTILRAFVVKAHRYRAKEKGGPRASLCVARISLRDEASYMTASNSRMVSRVVEDVGAAFVPPLRRVLL